jgi:glycosyltransferase 2 family protein
MVGRFAAAGAELASDPIGLLWILLPSIAIQFLSVLLIYVALHQLNVPVHFMACVLLVTPVMLLVTLPISIAGWGVREGALVVALGLSSVPAPEAVVASLLAGLAQLAVALPGGLLLLLYRSDRDRVKDREFPMGKSVRDRKGALGRPGEPETSSPREP